MSISGELRLDFRECVGAFATGVTVVTTHAQGQSAGMTLNSFTSVSLDPLLVLVSLAHATRTLEAIKSSNRFTVNVLHRNQRRTRTVLSSCATRSRSCAARCTARTLPATTTWWWAR